MHDRLVRCTCSDYLSQLEKGGLLPQVVQRKPLMPPISVAGIQMMSHAPTVTSVRMKWTRWLASFLSKRLCLLHTLQ